MEHKNVKLPKELLDYVERIAQERFEGNFSMAIRYCINAAKTLDDEIENLQRQMEVKG